MKVIGEGRPMRALSVEDSPGDVPPMREASRVANRVVHWHVGSDGVETLAFLRQEGAQVHVPRADIIWLDPNLPRMDGREVLPHIEEIDSLKTIPAVILTSADAEADTATTHQRHASCDIRRPMQLDEFEALVSSIDGFWLTKDMLPQGQS